MRLGIEYLNCIITPPRNYYMKLFKHQHWHLLSLLILLVCIYFCIKNNPSFLFGELFGINTSYWLVLAIFIPITHQVYVLLNWRLELFHQSLSKRFGSSAFLLFKIGFGVLFFSRLVSIILLAYSNENTLLINEHLSFALAAILFIPVLYLFYSVKKYFGIDRAFGIDHFQPEIFKNTPFVRQGIFKYTSNAMYVFGLLVLWIPGLLLMSKAALLAACFNHLYIWVHYYFTELPNMKVIYDK